MPILPAEVFEPEPAPPPGHAVVRIGAAAVNPSDVKATLGIMPQAVWPRTPGRDFAGTVVSGPAEWIGREVYGSGGDVGITRDGSHAQPAIDPGGAEFSTELVGMSLGRGTSAMNRPLTSSHGRMIALGAYLPRIFGSTWP